MSKLIKKFRDEEKQSKQGTRKADKRRVKDERKSKRATKQLKSGFLMMLLFLSFGMQAQMTPVFQHASITVCVDLPSNRIVFDTFTVDAHHEMVIIDAPTRHDTIPVRTSNMFVHNDDVMSYMFKLGNKRKTHLAIQYHDNEFMYLTMETKQNRAVCFSNQLGALLYLETRQNEY